MKNWLPILKYAILEWNRTFKINYFDFRHKMKEVTIENISKLKDAYIVTKSDKQILDLEKEDFLLYLIDDDDWVSENVFDQNYLKLEDNDDVVVWPFGFFRSDHVMITDIKKPIDDIRWVYSNNAIITSKGYRKLCEVAVDFLEDHREVDVCCQNNFVIKITHQVLSAYNHSPASATKLWGHHKHGGGSIRNLISGYGQIPLIPEELSWSYPYAKKIWNLILSLERKVFI
jgi:hypothetical protein